MERPQKYLLMLKRFVGVISPDYSPYYAMPFAQQIESTFKGRALGFRLQDNRLMVFNCYIIIGNPKLLKNNVLRGSRLKTLTNIVLALPIKKYWKR